MRGNIRETAVGEVGEGAKVLLRGRGDVLVQIGGHRAGLVIRARKVVAEAPGAGDPGDLGADGLGATDCGNVRACAWELRRELWCLFAVVGLTRCANACPGCVSDHVEVA